MSQTDKTEYSTNSIARQFRKKDLDLGVLVAHIKEASTEHTICVCVCARIASSTHLVGKEVEPEGRVQVVERLTGGEKGKVMEVGLEQEVGRVWEEGRLVPEEKEVLQRAMKGAHK